MSTLQLEYNWKTEALEGGTLPYFRPLFEYDSLRQVRRGDRYLT